MRLVTLPVLLLAWLCLFDWLSPLAVQAVSEDETALLELHAQVMQKLPDLTGSRCTCSVSGKRNAATSTVMVACQLADGFTEPDSSYQCQCHGATVACGTTQAISQISVASDLATQLCPTMVNATTTGVCSAAPDTGNVFCRPQTGLVREENTLATVTTGVDKRTGASFMLDTCILTVDRRACTSTAPCPGEPVDCVSEWSPFSTCSRTCGGGLQTSTLNILQEAQNGGVACPVPELRTRTRACNTQDCPQDCVVSNFSDWSTCSEACGGGVQSRTRTIITQPVGTGAPCPALEQFQACNLAACPTIDCQYSNFSACSACSATCGGGTCTRTRTILAQPSNGGAECTQPLTFTETCNANPCPQNCVVSEYSPFSECSATCGGGTRTRTRTVITPAANGGTPCPQELSQSEACATDPCPIACQVGEFGPWSVCDTVCGSGLQHRSRNITVFPEHGGQACPELVETQECVSTVNCNTACVLSDWTPFSQCSVTCGGGTQSRVRSVISRPNATIFCGELEESQACNTDPCPQDCQWGQWTDFSPCSASCGGGTSTRTRVRTQPALNGGKECVGEEQETMMCNLNACPVDCVLSNWTEFSACSAPCNGGMQLRTRKVLVEPINGGRECEQLSEERVCNDFACPTNCTLSDWSVWTGCSASCGGGVTTRQRTVVIPAANGGSCGDLTESQPCGVDACPVDCQVSSFGDWTACDKPCGGGSRHRERAITVQPASNGSACPPLLEFEPCNSNPCDVDCEVGPWSDFSQCDVPCGGGVQHRSRSVTVPAAGNGKACPPLQDDRTCNVQSCECVYGDWNSWSSCSAQCGTGYSTRARTLVSAPGNAKCDNRQEERVACNVQPCAQDCLVSAWHEWSQCSESCGDGIKNRSRAVVQPALYGGQACPELSQVAACNLGNCPRDCVVTAFGNWSDCDAPCGGGLQKRTRTVVTPSAYDGEPCPNLSEERYCNPHPCHTECRGSPWVLADKCDKQCGTGHRPFVRNVTVVTVNATNASTSNVHISVADCGVEKLLSECNTQPCPQDCQVSDWSPFSACSATAGAGIMTRSRTVVQVPANGGLACPALVDVRECNLVPHPLDCHVSGWSEWSACSAKCGDGLRGRTRTVVQNSAWGGAACPELVELEACFSAPCLPQNGSLCELTPWGEWTACSKSCGTGTKKRVRSLANPPPANFDVFQCGDLTEEVPCASQPCPQDCQVGDWSTQPTCTNACGGGETVKVRSPTTPFSNGGASCPDLLEAVPCHTEACVSPAVLPIPNPYPVPLGMQASGDCIVSSWSSWSICVQAGPCDPTKGVQRRTRSVLFEPTPGGHACPSLVEEEVCSLAANGTAAGSNSSSSTPSAGTGSVTPKYLVTAKIDEPTQCSRTVTTSATTTEAVAVPAVTTVAAPSATAASTQTSSTSYLGSSQISDKVTYNDMPDTATEAQSGDVETIAPELQSNSPRKFVPVTVQ